MTTSKRANTPNGNRRILLECDDPAIQDGLERVLHESGYVVSLCSGPASRSSGCALVESGRCGLVDDAEIVVHALDPVEPNREVLRALVEVRSGPPIVVEADVPVADGAGAVRTVRFPMNRAALLEALSSATGSSPGAIDDVAP